MTFARQRNNKKEDLQRYQEDHINKVEISLHKKSNKTVTKAGMKAGVKTGAKAPKSGRHLFMRKKLGKMTQED